MTQENIQSGKNGELPSLDLELDLPAERISLVLQQHNIPVVRAVAVENTGDEPARDVWIEIVSEPNIFAEPLVFHLAEIEPGETGTVENIQTKLRFEFFRSLSENVRTAIIARAYDQDPSANPKAVPIAQTVEDIDSAPFDYWCGLGALPLSLASFVTPNLDVVQEIRAKAGDILEQQGVRASFSGYQTGGRERVLTVAAALYDAVAALDIRYSEPPPSFLRQGQKIRFADEIVSGKFGACLDMSCLFASLFEACGLNSVILLVPGHAFVGVRLVDEYDRFPMIHDGEQLVKLVGTNDLAVFETTMALSGRRQNFGEAEKVALARLEEDKDRVIALDVKCARVFGVRPLPLLKSAANGSRLDFAALEAEDDSAETPLSDVREIRDFLSQDELRAETPQTRVDRWKQNLLDLTNRNALVNFKDSQKSLRLHMVPELVSEFESRLAAGDAFAIAIAQPDPKDEDKLLPPPDASIRSFYENGQIVADSSISPKKLDARLKNIRRAADASLAESGVTTLFVGIGCVRRYDEKLKKNCDAPLILVPVAISRSRKGEYTIRYNDEDESINVTLLELMKRVAGLEVPGLNPNDLPVEKGLGLDVDKIFGLVRNALREAQGWELREEVMLGIFSFQKFVMWTDLNANLDRLEENPLVKHLIHTPFEQYSDGVALPDADTIDSEFRSSQVAAPLSADSSQLAAVIAAAQGGSFVLQGPPGTGKSQTIANIIANSLYNGRKVLFVAEKRVALEVVQKRLEALGLGPFCLELHSSKAKTEEVKRQLREAVEFVQRATPPDWSRVAGDLDRKRDELNAYVEALHFPFPSGLTVYSAFSRLSGGNPSNEYVRPFARRDSLRMLELSRDEFENLTGAATRLQNAALELSDDAWIALRPCRLDEWRPGLEDELRKDAEAVVAAERLYRECAAPIAAIAAIDPSKVAVEQILAILELADELAKFNEPVPATFYDREWQATSDFIRRRFEASSVFDARDELATRGLIPVASALAGVADESAKVKIRALADDERSQIESLTIADPAIASLRTTTLEIDDRARIITAFLRDKIGLAAHGEPTVGAVRSVAGLLKPLLREDSPVESFLTNCRRSFPASLRRLDDAIKLRERHRAPFADPEAAKTAFLKIDVPEGTPTDAKFVPEGIFGVEKIALATEPEVGLALQDAATKDEKDPTGVRETLPPLQTALKDLHPAALDAIGMATSKTDDANSERGVSLWRTVLRGLAKLPFAGEDFIAKDWSISEAPLAEAVKAGKQFAEHRAKFADFDLDVLRKATDAIAACRRPGLPDGAFALADLVRTKQDGSLVSLAASPASGNSVGEGSEVFRSLANDAATCRRCFEKVVAFLQINAPVNEKSASVLGALFDKFRTVPAPEAGLDAVRQTALESQTSALFLAAEKFETIRGALLEYNPEKLLAFDVAAAREELAKGTAGLKKFFNFGWTKKFAARIVSELGKALSPDEKAPKPAKLIAQVEEYQTTHKELESLSNFGASAYGLPLVPDADERKRASSILALTAQLREVARELGDTEDGGHMAEFSLFSAWRRIAGGDGAAALNVRELVDSTARLDQELRAGLDLLKKTAREYSEIGALLDSHREFCRRRFGMLWKGDDSDWLELERAADAAKSLADDLREFSNGASPDALLNGLGGQWTERNPRINEYKAKIETFLTACDRFAEARDKFAPVLKAWKDEQFGVVDEIPEMIADCSSSLVGDYENPEVMTRALRLAEIVEEVNEKLDDPEVVATPDLRKKLIGVLDGIWTEMATDSTASNFLLAADELENVLKTFASEAPKLFPNMSQDASETRAVSELASLAVLCAAKEAALAETEPDRVRLLTGDRSSREFWMEAAVLAERLDNLDKVLARACSGDLGAQRDALGTWLAKAENASATGKSKLARARSEFEKGANALVQASDKLADRAKVEKPSPDKDVIVERVIFAEGLLRNLSSIPKWIAWNHEEKAIRELFPELPEAVLSGEVPRDEIAERATNSLCREFIYEAIAASEWLRNAMNTSREKSIAEFSKLIDRYSKLAQDAILARLAQELPQAAFAAGASEMGRLRRELASKGRRKKTRQLIADIPTLLPRLKPCLLMSPLSAAQYFPAGGTLYDVVVFDEASQIPVWDAVGAIARGRQLIVVGDSQQLPPTTFFQAKAGSDDDEASGLVKDPESILDECKSACVPQIPLRWHYRSRNEGLIAFSNDRYYEGKLNTFPSPSAKKNAGVSLVFVENGIYDRGGKKHNVREAERLVADVVARLRSPGFKGRSLGIVTFNDAQRTLIEDMLDAEREKHSELDAFFTESESNPDPVFVKNLENVQGDERDYMYFSVCYGPDADGKVSMNFGPLNRTGGERRLNVAITRAKIENIVYTSLRPDHFRLNDGAEEGKGSPKGVRDLCDFIRFAKTGDLPGAAERTSEGASDAFRLENEIAEYVSSLGYGVERRIGYSSYRVDLGILPPAGEGGSQDEAGEYFAAVICDGTTYRLAKSARDRELIRDGVLKGLGWNIIRVWSPEWYFHNEDAKRNLATALEKALARKRGTLPEEPEPDPEPAAEEAEESSAVNDAAVPCEDDDVLSPSVSADSNGFRAETYPDARYDGAFWDYRADRAKSRRRLEEIVLREGPVTSNLLFARVREMFDARMTEAMKSDVLYDAGMIRGIETAMQPDGQGVFFASDFDMRSWRAFRRHKEGANPRGIDAIPMREIANAAEFIRLQSGECEENELANEVARVFGCQRVTDKTREYVLDAIRRG